MCHDRSLMESSRSWLTVLPAATVVLLASSLALTHFPYIMVDDAAISFRYVERLVDGKGLTYNDHERVHGFSNPLYCFLLAGLHGCGVKVESAARLIGFACYLVAVALTFALGCRLVNGWAGLVAGLGLVSHAFFRFQALGGMESILTVSLGLAAVLAVDTRRTRLAALLLGLAILSKLDAGLLALAIGVAWMMTRRSFPKVLVLGSLATVAPWFLFSRIYYGAWLPNSLLVKLLVHSSSELDRWWAFRFMSQSNGLLLWVPIMVLAILTRRLARHQKLTVCTLLVWLLLQLTALALIDLGDPYPWYLTGLVPPLLILAGAGAALPFELLKQKRWYAVAAAASPAILLAVALAPKALYSLDGARNNRLRQYEAVQADRRLAGIFIDQYAGPDEVVASPFGWVAYECRRPFNDTSGLNSRTLLDRPAYVVSPRQADGSGPTPEGYLPVAVFDLAADLTPGSKWFDVFARPDSLIARQGPRLLKLRLTGLARPKPNRAGYGLDRVRVETERIIAPPPSSMVFAIAHSWQQPLHLVVTPRVMPASLDVVTFKVKVNDQVEWQEDRKPGEPARPVILPVAPGEEGLRLTLITESGEPIDHQDSGRICWESPKLVVGNPALPLTRLGSSLLSDQWCRYNPCPLEPADDSATTEVAQGDQKGHPQDP
jgi:hypothetical protein